MPKLSYAFIFLSGLLAMQACVDVGELPNARRLKSSQSERWLETPEAELDGAVPWRPSAILAISEETAFYLDRGTRSLWRFDRGRKTRQVLFHLAAYESQLEGGHLTRHWGQQLLRVDRDRLAVLGPKQAILWIHLREGSVEKLGQASELRAAEGLKLSEVDFRDLLGFGHDAQRLYFVFHGGLFSVPKPSGEAWLEELRESKLTHVAGKAGGESLRFGEALESRLDFSTWTEIVSLHGDLYFWEGQRLRLLRDGKILTLGGEGFQGPHGALKDFYARHLPAAPRLRSYRGKLYSSYWRQHRGLLEIDIKGIDMASGSSRSTLRECPIFVGSLSDFDFHAKGGFSVHEEASALWSVAAGLDDQERLFGEETEEGRLDKALTEYNVERLLAPQALTSLFQGRLIFVNAPSLSRLSMINSRQRDLFKNLYFSHYQTSIDQMVSDEQRRLWFSIGHSFYALQINEDLTVSFNMAQNFFRAIDDMGLPGTREMLRLSRSPQIESSPRGLYLYDAERQRIFEYLAKENRLETFMEPQRAWQKLGRENRSVQLDSLLIDTLTRWRVYGERWLMALRSAEGQNILALAYPKLVEGPSYGLEPKAGEIQVLSGLGQAPLEAGRLAVDGQIGVLEALGFAHDDGSILLLENREPERSFWRIDTEGRVHRFADFCSRLTGPEAYQALAYLREGEQEIVFLLSEKGELLACASSQMTWAGHGLGPQWRAIATEVLSFDVCWQAGHGEGDILYSQAQRYCQLTRQAQRCTQLPEGLKARHLSCSSDKVYLAMQPRAEQAAIYTAPWRQQRDFEYQMGEGLAMPRQGVISETAIGAELGKAVYDGFAYLYFWMKDSCSIWKIFPEPSAGIQEHSLIERVSVDPMLCRAKSFAINSNGDLAIIADDKLYHWNGKAFHWLSDLAPGSFDLNALNQAYLIMSPLGIDTYERGYLERRFFSGESIDGSLSFYPFDTGLRPAFLNVFGENAVYVPDAAGHRILKIALFKP